jgi:hypothetical protein
MDATWAASALTRLPRPVPVRACPTCGRDQPAGYAACGQCCHALERFWQADWAALLDDEGVASGTGEERLLAEVVVGEWDRHPFTALDIAMTLVPCNGCGRELGAGGDDCWPCRQAFGNSLAAEANGIQLLDHAWHIGRWVLRHPHLHGTASVLGWESALPGLMAGKLPSTAEAQRASRDLKRDFGAGGA